MYSSGLIVVSTCRLGNRCSAALCERVLAVLNTLRLHPDWGSLVICGVRVCLRGGSLQVEECNAGGRTKLSPGQAAIPAATGGPWASERPLGTPRHFGFGAAPSRQLRV